MKSSENYFEPFRRNVIGYDQTFETPQGLKRIVYADWTASGRLYRPIEERMMKDFGPFVANTHTETTVTGTRMTEAYHAAHDIIKKHVNADTNDVIITQGSGMTGVMAKFQRMLGLRIPEQISKQVHLPDEERPVVFVTHMEHHSNHTSWLETIVDVVCIQPGDDGTVDLAYLKETLGRYKNRKMKIASITACSNVTGIRTPIHDIARIMHQEGGLCFVDFACSAPYVPINMHPADPLESLDAIFLSPHKFLGGPGTPGVLIFNSKLYTLKVPDQPGGGTVDWTNPWGGHKYLDDIEAREDGGTPPFLQTIKAALCIRLKEKIGVENMMRREEEIVKILFEELPGVKGLNILAANNRDRLAVVSFHIDGLHYNLGVKLLNDYFGIQTRGGCSCAGTYGHYLLNIPKEVSRRITDKIDNGDLSEKPGWMRISLHPTMTNDEVYYIINALRQLVSNFTVWEKDYTYNRNTNEYCHNSFDSISSSPVQRWMEID